LEIGYDEVTSNITSSIEDQEVNIQYELINDNTNGCLRITEGSHNTANITLSVGLDVDHYSYSIKATATQKGKNTKIIDFAFNFRVTLHEIDDFTINNDLSTQTYNYTQQEVLL
jgi:hypothetical protein